MYTTRTFFKPFNKQEVDTYVSLAQLDQTMKEKIGEYDNAIPRMIFQCQNTPDLVDEWLHESLFSLLLELRYRLLTVSDYEKRDIMALHDIVMKGALGESLNEGDIPLAQTCGLFFKDGSSLKPVFRAHVLLKQLHTHVLRNYETFKMYNLGGAFEFLVSAQIRMQKNIVTCHGSRCHT